MHAVIRHYEHAAELIALMTERTDEVERVMSTARGFVQYHGIRNGNALTTVTICQDESGTEESTRLAAAWVRENLPEHVVKQLSPLMTAGDPFINFATPQRLASPAQR